MKAKYILLSAVVAFASMVIGCAPESLTGSDASVVTLESSYYQMPAKSGSVVVKFTATDAWELFEEASYTWKDEEKKSHTVDTLIIPNAASVKPHGVQVKSWLTADKISGSEGEHSVTLTASDSENYNSVTLHLVCGGVTQHIVVAQNESTIVPATCAEVAAGPDGKVFMVTGICTGIANDYYGNWYMNDGTGEVYIYGTVNDKGEYDWGSFNIAVGDEVTVQGPMKNYSGTIELIDASVIKVKKALLSVDVDNFSIGASAQELTIKAVVKGDSFTFSSDASWANVASVTTIPAAKEGKPDTTQVIINIAENLSVEGRTAHVSFASASGKDASELSVKIVQAGLKGQSPDNPYTVDEAIKAIEDGTAGSNKVYVKGIISQIDAVDYGYGNAQYWISDDGTTTKQMEVFRGLKFGGENFVEGDCLGLGWEVVVYGALTKYKETYEIDQKNNIYSIFGATAQMSPSEVIAYIDSEDFTADNKVIVTGVVNEVNISLQYGNAEIWISDDGSQKAFELYRNFYFNGVNYTAEDQVKVGDVVAAVGVVKKYGDTYEMDKNNFMLVVNGQTAVETVAE